jgi:hypothetical protein
MSLDLIVDDIFSYLDVIFKSRWIAPLVFFPFLLVTGCIIVLWARYRVSSVWRAIKRRKDALVTALGTTARRDEEMIAFADAFGDVSTALARSGGWGVRPLIRAWEEFHESIIDETASSICNTARPWTYFQRAVPRRPELIFWSNFAVGLGLVLTFFGIVVALNAAAKGMHQGATVQESQTALRDLLIVASAKFFSSIGGLAASLILRAADAALSRKSEKDVHQLCDLLERGLCYMPMQRLGVDQLGELKRQSAQFEKFNTDLALSIGEQVGKQFQNVISPVRSSLDALDATMQGMSKNLGEKLGEGVGKAIENASSGELKLLAQTQAQRRSDRAKRRGGQGSDFCGGMAGADHRRPSAGDDREPYSERIAVRRHRLL